MAKLTYRATVDGRPLVIRFTGEDFETTGPAEALLDDPPRCAGSAGAHAWWAVVLAWRHRGDRHSRWERDVVRDIVADARTAWGAGVEGRRRPSIHDLQEAAGRRAREAFPPAPRPPAVDVAALPPALRHAVVQPPQRAAEPPA